MKKLINDLITWGYLKSDILIEAFSKIKREEFLPTELRSQAELNIALPIGYGQTISQPLTVAFILELLDPCPGQKILDVGSGSGWTTALLAFVVGEKGKVIALERIGPLLEFGKKNVQKFKIIKSTVEFYLADGSLGFSPEAPFDRILVSAAAQKIPLNLKEQLKIGGKLVIPIGDSIYYLEKRGANDFWEEKFSGFEFVPLVKD